jgi:hypothetical protein
MEYPGTNPTVSSDGIKAGTGIVWIIQRTATPSGILATLHAYDASNLARELYNSDQNAPRDALGLYVKFSVPTEIHGRVYVGTDNSLVIYGLLKDPSSIQRPVRLRG